MVTYLYAGLSLYHLQYFLYVSNEFADKDAHLCELVYALAASLCGHYTESKHIRLIVNNVYVAIPAKLYLVSLIFLHLLFVQLSETQKRVGMTRKCHNYTMQTNPRQREEETQNANSHMPSKGN